jgi:hypothetical protein
MDHSIVSHGLPFKICNSSAGKNLVFLMPLSEHRFGSWQPPPIKCEQHLLVSGGFCWQQVLASQKVLADPAGRNTSVIGQ